MNSVRVHAALQWLDSDSDCTLSGNGEDSDQDGIEDTCDNCILLANAAPTDTDSGGFGNRCDADLNNDGLVLFPDVIHFIRAFGTTGPDSDSNGDGHLNFFDILVLLYAYLTPPGPSALAP
jgi:subtilisin